MHVLRPAVDRSDASSQLVTLEFIHRRCSRSSRCSTSLFERKKDPLRCSACACRLVIPDDNYERSISVHLDGADSPQDANTESFFLGASCYFETAKSVGCMGRITRGGVDDEICLSGSMTVHELEE